ncbi:RNase adapter RapZ [Pandoraea nosoerga]|uniref:Nucleotide-binding protein n=1 Tax=Pandoraea nosoerga TaxID=2508296 RepID=A0A5E4RN32_9BURK|nr:RNase adapter RapZ [Pandoraea nosoerga]MBN4674411.1 RNase adapter RapZ [Pandoraea nosoerga]MBN4679679.1 RNase adapter RapZ [Pandoraea nosoerga]MBN4743232.1 RNase adapter RapZ [Pandoraea nosoerga]VVD64820.1 nucleotide-binding protein [Pandoraea nosoerga]
MKIVLITGVSGSGKSLALNVLEDAGYYCVDNLPSRFLPELAEYLETQNHTRLAVAIDARSGGSLADLPPIIGGLRRFGHDVRVLFLNANTQTLVQRFSETRRRHPLSVGDNTLSANGSLVEAIEKEREMLNSVTELGHQIDTSNLRASALRRWIREFVQHDHTGLTLMFESFGFKHGVPLDADLVFDVRSLPNPYYDTQLRPLTGRDQPVIDFLSAIPEVAEMIDDIGAYLQKWLPSFMRDNRSYLTVAIGCTGGQHRSVFIAETLGARFRQEASVLVRHRELAPLEAA